MTEPCFNCCIVLDAFIMMLFIMNGKENLEDYPPPAKKRRPSLFLRKQKTSPLQKCAVNVSRFPILSVKKKWN